MGMRSNSVGAEEFPNNTQALAMGNMSNIQQLSKTGISTVNYSSKPKKILILKQKRKPNEGMMSNQGTMSNFHDM
jgi:hypothetical protein